MRKNMLRLFAVVTAYNCAITLIICGFLGSFWNHAAAQENHKANVQFYVNAYGLADPEANRLIKRAYSIFDRICLVADKRGYRQPNLKIVNSMGDPISIALPDGHIVLSKRAVEICYSNVGLSQGDARMAFILGHELAHLANDDFWHMEVYMALAGDQNDWSKRLQAVLNKGAAVPAAEENRRLVQIKKEEMKADDLGALYATIAGYPVDVILGDNKDEKDFFSYLMEQTHTKVDISHPHPKERARLLQIRLKNIQENICFYQFGVRLAHFGRYEDAVYFLHEFQQKFPAREVFNNLGYCYLQMAIKKMPPKKAFEYWLPSILDFSTRAELLTSRTNKSELEIPKAALGYLKQAVNYFEKACGADPTYLPCHLNLAVAYFYLKDIYKARAKVEDALKLDPDNAKVKCLRALVIYKEAFDIDMWPQTVKTLEKILVKGDKPLFIMYNLASLLEDRKRKGEARTAWNQLFENLENIPDPYRAYVCKKAGRSGKKCVPVESNIQALPWNLPVTVGSDLLKEKQAHQTLMTWKKISYYWQNKMMSGHIYISPNGSSVLEVNDFIEMVVLKGEDFGTAQALVSKCGMPDHQRNVCQGTVWTYGPNWSALVKDGMISEVWTSE